MRLARVYFDFNIGNIERIDNTIKEFDERLKKITNKLKLKKLFSGTFKTDSSPAENYLNYLFEVDDNTAKIIEALHVMKEASQDELAKALHMKYNTLRVHLRKLEPILDISKQGYPHKLKLAIEILPSYILAEERLKDWDSYRKEFEREYKKEKESQDFEIETLRRQLFKK